MTGRKGRDSAAARRSGNVYNRPSYGAVGNAVCRLWESSFYFSTGCERRFPWRNGRLCTFPLCYLFIFQRSRSSAHSIGQRPIRSVPGERAASSDTELFGGLGASPNKRFCGAKRQSVYHSALLASFVLFVFQFLLFITWRYSSGKSPVFFRNRLANRPA